MWTIVVPGREFTLNYEPKVRLPADFEGDDSEVLQDDIYMIAAATERALSGSSITGGRLIVFGHEDTTAALVETLGSQQLELNWV